MDTLGREISAIVEAEILPLVEKPFEGKGWRAQLNEMLDRRAYIYDRIMPLKIAGSAYMSRPRTRAPNRPRARNQCRRTHGTWNIYQARNTGK